MAERDDTARRPPAAAGGDAGEPGVVRFTAAEKATQEHLSIAARTFLDYVERHPRLVRRASFEPLFASLRAIIPSVPGTLKEERYVLQPWPTLISSARRREFEKVSVGLFRLVRDLPRRVFGNDAGAVADYYGLADESAAELLLSEPNGFERAVCRVDFLDTRDGLQCLEFNAGSVGGWQQDGALGPAYLRDPEMAAFFAAAGLEPRSPNSIRRFFRNIIRDSVAGTVPRDRELNVLIAAADTGHWSTTDHPPEIYQAEFAAALAETAAGWSGRVAIVGMSEVELRDGGVWARGTRFHAVFEQQDRITDVSRGLFRSFKAGLVNLYTGAISMLLGDKRSLALLSKLEGSELFTPEERELIRTYVPWTRLVSRRQTIYEGQRISFPELLASCREDLVLKAGQSYGGKDVLFGKAMEEDAWHAATRAAIEDGGWVVQKYLEPTPYVYQEGEAGWCPYDVAWGPFVFGGDYGGMYVRMLPRGRGAVNLSRGAAVGLMFEVDED